MTKRLSLLVSLLLIAVSAAVVSAPAAAPKVVVGIAEQHPNLFTDSRFTGLHITHVRLDLAWDALSDKGQKAAADAYMKAAHKDKVDVLVTFDRSRRVGHTAINPTPVQLAGSLTAMHKRWPWVTEFSTWNEVNVAKKSDVVAKWWLALRKACPKCTILGGDLLDRSSSSDVPSKVASNIHAWITGFLKTTHGVQPSTWGIHNYIDANKMRTSGTAALLRYVKGRVWFTETGGLVSRHNKSHFVIPQGGSHATATTKFILTKLDRISSRIQRVYLYEWTPSGVTWDSAFTSAKGTTRSSLTYLKKFLAGTAR